MNAAGCDSGAEDAENPKELGLSKLNIFCNDSSTCSSLSEQAENPTLVLIRS